MRLNANTGPEGWSLRLALSTPPDFSRLVNISSDSFLQQRLGLELVRTTTRSPEGCGPSFDEKGKQSTL